VHEIPSGSTIDENQVVTVNGNFVAQFDTCGYTPIITRPTAPTAGDSGVDTPSTDGWQSATIQYLPGGATTWNAVSAEIVVPPAPVDTDATNYYFNGLEPINSHDSPILQPVLQYGKNACGSGCGNFWSVSAYQVFYNGAVNYTIPLRVSTGDTLIVQVYLQTVSGGTFNYVVIAYDNNLGKSGNYTYAQTSNNGGTLFPLFFPAVHESYNDNACENGVNFFDIWQEANVNTGPINRVNVSPDSVQYACDEGTSPSCFDCPYIQSGTNTVVF